MQEAESRTLSAADLMRDKMLIVSKIYDDDYGCEEREPNAPKMAIVYLKDDDGNEKELKVPDDFLVANGIVEGSIWKWR